MNSIFIIKILNSSAALITAIAALLAGITSIINAIINYRKQINSTVKNNDKEKFKMKKNRNSFIRYGIIPIVFALSVFAFRILFAQGIPLNQKLTSAAWKYYNNNDFISAIEQATQCISMFSGQAEIEQEDLISKKVAVPGENPQSQTEKNTIFSRGLLNDVSTCYFILGQAYEKLGKKSEATKAYLNAGKFPHATAYDPSGPWFWNVAKAARGRIRQLERN
jgi:hypothetical protein